MNLRLPDVVLVARALGWRLLAGPNLMSADFDAFGRWASLRHLKSGDRENFLRLMCNPISIVRYFEFDFTRSSVDWHRVGRCLDLSSPRLFFAFLLNRYPNLTFELVNPDRDDLADTARLLRTLSLDRAEFNATRADEMTFEPNSFDVITSLSVLEHIPDGGDTEAISCLWRLLRHGGSLIVTVPCMRIGFEEWRDEDTYGLAPVDTQKRFFFQRHYDREALETRLIDALGQAPSRMQFFGERNAGTFVAYRERWIEHGLSETLKDPFYIAKQYRTFPELENLPGRGVCGLAFRKG